jgi:hypothetical protein
MIQGGFLIDRGKLCLDGGHCLLNEYKALKAGTMQNGLYVPLQACLRV